MEFSPELLNFFGNPDLDRHRLLQGRWEAFRMDWDDPEAWSDDPLELLLNMLGDELREMRADSPPALQALDALLSTALANFSQPEFSSVTRSFWRGFQFVARSAALEKGIVFRELSRDDIRRLISTKYQRHAA